MTHYDVCSSDACFSNFSAVIYRWQSVVGRSLLSRSVRTPGSASFSPYHTGTISEVAVRRFAATLKTHATFYRRSRSIPLDPARSEMSPTLTFTSFVLRLRC